VGAKRIETALLSRFAPVTPAAHHEIEEAWREATGPAHPRELGSRSSVQAGAGSSAAKSAL
jgi:hypothetical protein